MIGEILIYAVVAICALFVSGYAVHMFVGGLVSPEVEFQIIALVCLMIAAVIGYMAWDVFQRRSGKK
jgi:multisubunit Na+/H+ antiporter MnhB subunit